jgi:vacuolar-type H+-ATPase subunit E/Vma4
MSYLQFWKWPREILSFIAAIVTCIGLYYVGDWVLARHYAKKTDLRIELATKKADARNEERKSENLARINEALKNENQRILSNAASANSAKLERDRLRNTVRELNERAGTSLSSCVQNANALSGLFDSISEFAERTAKEANGHVADKLTCFNSWPR